MKDFFISYNGNDKAWAEWIAWTLEEAGHEIVIQAWDFRPGENFVLEMHEAAKETRATVIVLSQNYLDAEYTHPEWAAAFVSDPKGSRRKLIPCRIGDCQPDGLLAGLIYVDLIGLDDSEAETAILKALEERAKPDEKPGFPGSKQPTATPPATRTVERPATYPGAKISIAHLPAAPEHFVGRVEEMKTLDAAWEDDGTNVISLVAFGGVGKSALVGEWLRRLARDDWRGARYVLGHSFYSQGAREDAQASADAFIDQALRFFGDEHPESGSPWDKGERLARLVRTSKTLLVLDGMEPLQYGPSAGEPGKIKDPALQALVKELAVANQGLCVITTREDVSDIPAAPSIDLEQLKPPAGAALLKALGVKGTQGELQDASRSVRGHGLALTLLGTYLRKALGGDVRKIGEVELSKADTRQGGHARKLMEKYERWLGEGVEVEILRLLGLFDRPAEAASLAAVRAVPAIAGLTDSMVDLSEEDWNWAVSNLREYGLVAKEASAIATSLDAHPLVREHFAAQLVAELPEATREAHHRLYEYLKQSAPEFPDNLPDMMPLYHAVAHGCKAGMHLDAHNNVYWRRVLRDFRQAFSIRELGTFGADLAAISNFFDKPWNKPNGSLSTNQQAYVLANTAFYLRALGRMQEVFQPMQKSLELVCQEKNWLQAALAAGNLSELYLTLGDVRAAVRAAEQSVELADHSSDVFEQSSKRTTLADALHQSGRPERALVAFREAEMMQVEQQPMYPLLYSLWGFRYCDLLLEEVSRFLDPLSLALPAAGEPHIESALRSCHEVRRRAETALEWYRRAGQEVLLDIALDHLTLGRTYLLEGQVSIVAGREPEAEVLTQAEAYLNQSVSLLRQAGDQTYLPRGLLARAALWRVCGEWERGGQGEAETEYFERVERDLGEVEQIAGRSRMLIWQIEAALERCRLALTREDHAEARRTLDEARALVKKTETPYEPHVPDWDEWEPPEYVGVIPKGEIVGYHRRNEEIAALDEVLKKLGA